MGHRGFWSAAVAIAASVGLSQRASTTDMPSTSLFVWAGDADKRESDFMAVVDVDPRSASYASVVATVPVGATGTRPHHTDYEMPADGRLWANGFDTGQTFRFDLSDPRKPRLLGSFGDAAPFTHPHSYARLASGNVVATFQHGTGERGVEAGGTASPSFPLSTGS
jgi:hypothetical protein